MKKVLLSLVVLSLVSFNVNAGKSYSGFSRSNSFSGFSRITPKPFTRPMPKVSRPTPVIIQRRTTVVQQHNEVNQGGGLGTSIAGSLIGGGIGSYIGTRMAQPNEAPPPNTMQQFPLCPNPVPVGWNTPCIPQPQGFQK